MLRQSFLTEGEREREREKGKKRESILGIKDKNYINLSKKILTDETLTSIQ